MRLSTRGVVAVAVGTVALLLGLVVAYAVWGLHAGVEPRLLALDLTVLAVGHAGLTVLIGFHVRALTMHRIEEATQALRALAAGRFEHRVAVDGPTEVHALLAATNAAAEAAERRQRLTFQESSTAAITDVLLGVSHEIRNPLASLRISATVVQELEAGEAGAAARRILRSIDRLEEVVSTLEVVGRAGIRDGVDANRIVRGALMAVQGSMLHLLPPELDLEARQPVRCDPARVMQALTAVVANAIEASPGASQILVRTRDGADHVRIEIEDEGPGLAPELGDRVFDAFVTTKAGHAGLGLSLARQVLEAQQASLTLERGHGVRAVLRLPTTGFKGS